MVQVTKGQVQQLLELRQKHVDLQTVWYRHMLTLAAGGLVVLAGLNPAVPAEGIARYLLAGTWGFLGLGIVAGCGATFLEVSAANNLANNFHEQLLKNLQGQQPISSSVPIVAKPHLVLSWCKPIMLCSLLAAVVCLVSYSVLITLQPLG